MTVFHGMLILALITEQLSWLAEVLNGIHCLSIFLIFYEILHFSFLTAKKMRFSDWFGRGSAPLLLVLLWFRFINIWPISLWFLKNQRGFWPFSLLFSPRIFFCLSRPKLILIRFFFSPFLIITLQKKSSRNRTFPFSRWCSLAWRLEGLPSRILSKLTFLFYLKKDFFYLGKNSGKLLWK